MEELGITVSFMGETIKFDKTISGMEKAIKLLKKEVKYFNKELKFDPKNVDILTKKINNLRQQEALAAEVMQAHAKAMAELTEKGVTSGEEFDDLRNRIDKAANDFIGIRRQLVGAEHDLEALNAATEESINKWDALGDQLKKTGGEIESVGQFIKPVSDAASKFLKNGIQSAIEFENAFADVKKTVEATEEEFDIIELGLRNLARTVPTTADELARIAGLAGQMGVPASDIVKFTKAMVDFGNATNITAEDAAQQIAQIYNVIGKGGDFSDLDNLLSTIVELGNNTATTEAYITEMFRNISASASRVGMTSEQMAALAATLASLGLDKGGASAISNIMTQIDMAVATNNSSLKKWAAEAHVSVKEFKRLWQDDAAGALVTLLEGMKQTVDEGGNLNEVFNDLKIKELRRVDTLGRLVNGQNVYTDALKLANNAYEEGTALQNEANKRYETTASQFQILKNNLTEFAMALGETLLPAINNLVDMLREIVDWFNSLSPLAKQAITTMLIITATLGPLLVTIGKFLIMLGTLVVLMPKIKTGMMAVKAVMSGLGTSIASVGKLVMSLITGHPIVAAIVGLVAVIVLLYNKCEWFRNLVKNLVSWIKDLWKQFQETQWMETLGEKFGEFGMMVGFVLDVFKGLVNWFGKLIKKAGEFIGLSDSAGGAIDRFSGISKGGRGFIASGGFMSGGLTLNNSFTINNADNITETTVMRWADVITDRVNENLGRMYAG